MNYGDNMDDCKSCKQMRARITALHRAILIESTRRKAAEDNVMQYRAVIDTRILHESVGESFSLEN